MRAKHLLICCAASLTLASATNNSLAQGRGGGPAAQPSMQPGVPGNRDMDRLRDRLDTPDQDRLRDRDRDTTADRDRDRDRLKTDQAEAQIGAWSLLTDAERTQFRREIQTATTTQDRERIRSEHREAIRDRAKEMGLADPFGTGKAAAGARQQMMMSQLLTQEEQLRFREQMRTAATEQERQRVRSEHQEAIRERAKEMGVDVPPNFGRSPR